MCYILAEFGGAMIESVKHNLIITLLNNHGYKLRHLEAIQDINIIARQSVSYFNYADQVNYQS